MKTLTEPVCSGQNKDVERTSTDSPGSNARCAGGRRPLAGGGGAGGGQGSDHVGGGGLRYHRPARAWPLSVEAVPIVLPPVPAARQGGTGGRWQMLLPVLGSLAMVGFAFVVRSLVYLVVIGLMVVSMVGATLGAQIAGNREEKRRWARTKTRYLELVSNAAAESQRASELQLAGLSGLYPGPDVLLSLIKAGDGTWERRRTDPDFAWVRIGLGKVAAARPVRLGDHGPAVAEPDPELASAADRVVAGTAMIPLAPVSLPLARLGVLAVVAPGPTAITGARAMVAAWLASLAGLHAPGDLRIAGLFPEEMADSWDWLKWLPHCRALQGGEGFGRAQRSVSTDPVAFAELTGDLVRSRSERPRGTGAAELGQLGLGQPGLGQPGLGQPGLGLTRLGARRNRGRRLEPDPLQHRPRQPDEARPQCGGQRDRDCHQPGRGTVHRRGDGHRGRGRHLALCRKRARGPRRRKGAA